MSVLPFRPSRTGWFGIPLGVAIGFSALVFVGGDSRGHEMAEFAVAAMASGVGGWLLPWPDSPAALVIGPALGAVLIFLVGAGVDNPMPFLIAGCTLAFTIGAAASTVATLLRRRRVRVTAHG